MSASTNNPADPDAGRKRSGRMDKTSKPLVVRPRIATKLLGCSVGRVYELIASGVLKSFLDGPRARRISVDSIRANVARQLAAGPGTLRDTSAAVAKSIAARRTKAAAKRVKGPL
jgi:hypothetical protein